jgi:hypothetical protein
LAKGLFGDAPNRLGRRQELHASAQIALDASPFARFHQADEHV